MPKTYLPQLDGLRAIAILAVMAFHFDSANLGPFGLAAHFSGFDLGWTGVVLFFVLSGYLITQVLLGSKGQPRYFRNFYANRALRILPAYYLTLLMGYAAISVLSLRASPAEQSGGEWVSYLLFGSNYWLGYNGIGTPASQVLGISWTLSVEEQFYLLWPMVIWRLSPRMVLRVCIGLLLASPVLRWALMHFSGNALLTYFSFTSNLDGLALGALIAVMRNDERLRRFVGPGTGLILVGVSTVSIGANLLQHGSLYFADPARWMSWLPNLLFFPLSVATGAAGLVMVAMNSDGVLARMLSVRPLVAIGRISYGIYLYHVLINFVLTRYVWIDTFLPIPGNNPPQALIPALYAARYAVTILIAAASYRYLEKPLLSLRIKLPKISDVAGSTPVQSGLPVSTARAFTLKLRVTGPRI